MSQECTKCGGTGVKPDAVIIGAEMRQKRKVIGLTCADVARELGVTRKYVSVLELGRQDWPLDLLARYKEVLKRHQEIAAKVKI